MAEPIYMKHAWWEHILMFIIPCIFAAIGAEFVKLFSGYKCPCRKKKLPNCLGPIKVPPLIGAIFFGLLSRYMTTWSYESYNVAWAAYGRSYPLLVVICWGGLEIYARKVSYIAILFALLPLLSVTIVNGLVTALAVDFPWVLGFMSGVMLNGIAPTVIVILMLQLIQNN